MNEDWKKKLVDERGLTTEQAESILERAQQIQIDAETAAGRVSLGELKEGAAEVGIDARLVDEARVQLEREGALRTKRRQVVQRAAAIVAAAVVVVLLLTTLYARSTLSGALEDVERAQAQVENVQERQRALIPQLVGLAKASAAEGVDAKVAELERLSSTLDAASAVEAAEGAQPEADEQLQALMTSLHATLSATSTEDQQVLLRRLADEITGAENRVRFEKKRLNEARAAYQRRARGIPVAWVLPLTGLPERP